MTALQSHGHRPQHKHDADSDSNNLYITWCPVVCGLEPCSVARHSWNSDVARVQLSVGGFRDRFDLPADVVIAAEPET